MSHVAGFTVAHDVSARDWQMHKNGGQWLIGKTFDTFCPLGPAIVTRAALSGTLPVVNPILSFVTWKLTTQAQTRPFVFSKSEQLLTIMFAKMACLYMYIHSIISAYVRHTFFITDPHKLGIRCRLNGEIVQNSNTEQLVHKTEALVAFISR